MQDCSSGSGKKLVDFGLILKVQLIFLDGLDVGRSKVSQICPKQSQFKPVFREDLVIALPFILKAS